MLYKISSATEWARLQTLISIQALTSGDVVRLAADIALSTSTAGVLNVGAATFNGNGYTITLTINSSATGIMTLGGGTLCNLNISTSGTASFKTVLLTDGSYGTVQDCVINGGNNTTTTYSSDIYGGVLMSKRLTQTQPLIVTRVAVVGIAVGSSTQFAGLVGDCASGGDVTVSECLVKMTAGLNFSGIICSMGSASYTHSVTKSLVYVTSTGSGLLAFTYNTAGPVTITECAMFMKGTTGSPTFFYQFRPFTAHVIRDSYLSVVDSVTNPGATFVFENSSVTTPATVSLTRCALYVTDTGSSATLFLRSTHTGVTYALTNCFLNLNSFVYGFGAAGTASVTGTMLVAANAATATTAFVASTYWQDVSGQLPIIASIATSAFITGYNSFNLAGTTTGNPVAAAVGTFDDGDGQFASAPTSGSTFTSAGATTIVLTTAADWIALAAATASTPLAANQTVQLANDLVFVAAPGTLGIGAATFDGYGNTVTLSYAGSTHTPLASLTGGVVSNMSVVNNFLSEPGSVTAVVATAGSYGTFRNVRCTGNALHGSVVSYGVVDHAITVTKCSFDGDVVASSGGGLVYSSGPSTGAPSSGTVTFTCSQCTSRARLIGATTAAIAYQLNGISGSAVNNVLLSQCSARVTYAASSTGCAVFYSSGGVIQQCYALCTLSNMGFVQYLFGGSDPAHAIVDSYYVNTNATGVAFVPYVSMAGHEVAIRNCYFVCHSNSYFITSNNGITTLSNCYSSAPARAAFSQVGTLTGTLGNTSALVGAGGAAALMP